ncbi:PhzF family phenazine biosynthesis protein [Larkinella ripae]
MNAFVDGEKGGNPAGIVLHADRFDRATKQHIAAQVGLSETAFVSSSSVADFKLEFFTPVRQIAQCGHATIATFSYLAQLGLLPDIRSSMETVDGPRAIHLDGDQAFMEQTAPVFTAPEALFPEAITQQVFRSLGISEPDLIGGLSPLIVNTGNSFMVVPLRASETVRQIRPDFAGIASLSERLGLIGFYLFAPDAEQSGRDAGARMFAPAYGIPEEAATGMAAGPLACYLYHHLKLQKTTFRIEQGYLMNPPSPSLLTARLHLEADQITGLMVGGRARVSHTVEIALESVGVL